MTTATQKKLLNQKIYNALENDRGSPAEKNWLDKDPQITNKCYQEELRFNKDSTIEMETTTPTNFEQRYVNKRLALTI